MSRWPFLVARGRRVGYRVVLAPDFLVRNRQHHLLAEHVGAGPAGPDGRSVVELPTTGFGPVVVTYREEHAAAAELLPGSEPETLRDRHGRPLELLYGVVTAGRPEPVDDRDLAEARDAAIEAYRRFLADEEGADVQPSPGSAPHAAPPAPQPVARPERPARPVPARRPAPQARPGGRRWVVAAAAVVAVVVAVLFGGRLLAGDGDGDPVGVTETPGATPAKCSEVEAGPMTEQPEGPDRKGEPDKVPCR
ncbi:hypothetical protein [Pseudonocardia cypriaca]|uniref:Uncharacterized protein n=1 Tax=Pseudonocardia cypriaca TaxID=882449 RepID=A0A543FX61_9PSEU|nr:hypothetical protein [Pseudonocardia cypriaca]TQM38423.1 hypothetical protein FB388_5657 [Pseudonocardia cypriaca]